MGLKPCYKQTEIGPLPEDWDCIPFSKFVAIQRGHDLTARQRQRGDIPVMGSAGLNGYHDTAKAKGPGVVIGRSGASYGQAHWCEVDFWPHNTALYVTDFFGNDPRFAFYALRETDFSRHNSGGAQQSLNRNFIAGVLMARPPEKEQVAIRRCLDDMDAANDAWFKLIAKKRGLRNGVMQRLLTGETRLPGFSAAWDEKRLGDHVSFLKNGVQSRAQLTLNDPVRYLHYGDIHVAQNLRLNIREAEMPRLPKPDAARLSRLEDGDVVFVDASEDLAGVGKSLEVVNAEGIEAVAGQHTIAARFDKEVLADGFKGYLQHIPAFTTHLRRLAAGTKVYATNRKHIASAEILLPEPDEQRAIVRVLSDMDAEITALEARLEKTRALKQGMMQALLTGRVRLPVQGKALDALEVAHA